MDTNGIFWTIAVLLGLYILYRIRKKKKLKKQQAVQQKVQPVAAAAPLSPLEELKKEFVVEGKQEDGDIVQVSEKQMAELDEQMKQELADFNKKLRETNTQLTNEEMAVYQKGQELLKRQKLLEATRARLDRKLYIANSLNKQTGGIRK